MSRPSDFTEEVATQICVALSGGRSLRSICEDEGMPDRATVFRWLGKHAEFRDQYAHARASQADAMLEEILEIADAGTKAEDIMNPDVIQRAKLRIDTRKWVMSKVAPKKYGEKLELSGDPENPLHTITRIELVAPGE